MMDANTKTFDFDIRPSTTHVSISPKKDAEVTFQVHNTSDHRQRAEVILEPTAGPTGAGKTENLGDWLQLVESPEYDYQPQGQRNYTARIKVSGPILPGDYRFRLLVVGHDDPDHEFQASDEITVKVAAKRINALPFVIGGILLLVLITAGIIFALMRTKPPSGLSIKLDAPKEATVGQTAEYTLTIENLDGTTAEKVVLEYAYPAGILGAWVSVQHDPNLAATVTRDAADLAVASHCGTSEERLRCVVERIGPQQKVTLAIHVLPGPIYADPDVPTATATSQSAQIDNRGRFTVHWMEDGAYHENLALAPESNPFTVIKPVKPEDVPVSGAAIPAVDTASVGLPVKISLFGWSNRGREVSVDLQYPLQDGMRFASYPDQCKQQTGIYSTLLCSAQSGVPIEIQVIPMKPTTGYEQILLGKETDKTDYQQLAAITLPAENNQMILNGVDEWVQLGYAGLPETFTVEMWVNPASLEDGQALIGAHRQRPNQQEVLNRFLIGYYNNAINVNVMGFCKDLKLAKTSDPFHLAVVVKSQNQSIVVYQNSEEVELNDEVCCQNCSGFTMQDANESNGEVDLNWVIGQDWDANGSGIIRSDFFHGAISDVRIYARPLGSVEVQQDMYLPPQLCGTDENCDQPDLIGWWPLERTSEAAADRSVECTLSRLGLLSNQPDSDACALVDLGPNNYNGARNGGSWEIEDASFGDALAFNGRNALYLDSVLVSDFIQNPTVKITSTTPPTATPTIVNAATLTPTPSNVSFDISAVSINGLGNQVSVEPGAPITIKYDYRLRGIDGCPGCIIELVTGLGQPKSHGKTCAYYGIPGIFPGKTGSENAVLEAPKEAGNYPVVVYYFAEYNCANALNAYGSPDTTNKRTVGNITVIAATSTPTRTAALVATETALKATQTALAATQTALVTSPTATRTLKSPDISMGPAEPDGAPVTISAWIYMATVPSQQQTILAASFSPGNGKVRVTLSTAQDGHMRVIYQNKESEAWAVRDEKNIPAGRWVHYAVVFWFDQSSGALIGENLLLFRDGLRVKTSPDQYEEPALNVDIPDGFYFGGLGKSDCDSECFTGWIDEVRIWNRALYKPLGNQSYISPEIDFWRRLPGVTFDEYVYWSFDNHSGTQARALCPNRVCDLFDLSISGPAWVPNDLSINYNE